MDKLSVPERLIGMPVKIYRVWSKTSSDRVVDVRDLVFGACASFNRKGH